MVVLRPGFVARDLAVQLVGQLIDSGVQISVGTFGKQIASLDVYIAFGSLASLLFFHVVNGQKDFYIHYLIEMPGDPV